MVYCKDDQAPRLAAAPKVARPLACGGHRGSAPVWQDNTGEVDRRGVLRPRTGP